MSKGRTCLNCDRLVPSGESLRNDRCEPCNRYWQRNRRERNSDPEPVGVAAGGIDWGRAACLHADPDAFVPDVGQSAWEAKAVCRGCPIMGECREFGLSVPPYIYKGVYGALSERERREVRGGRLTEAEVDAHDAEVASVGGQRALAASRGGDTKRRQADERSRQARCGTASGYKAHRRRDEEPCDDCAEAHRMYQREYKRRQKREAA